MTETSDNNVVQLSQYQVHFCLVSDQPAANFLPIVYYKPKVVVLIVSPNERIRKLASDLKDALKKSSPDIQIHQLNIKSAYDVNSTLMEIWGQLDCYKEKNLNPIVNLTGGTKLMAFAALRAASAANCDAFYLDIEKSAITVFQAGNMDGETRIPAIEFQSKLNHYFESYGYTCKLLEKMKKNFSKEDEELVCELATRQEIREAIPFMNKFVSEAEGTNQTIGLGKEKKKPKNAKLRLGIEKWIREFERAGYVSRKEEELCFPDEGSRFFAAGGWLEEYVALRIQELGYKTWLNLEVRKGTVKNELDVAFFKNGRPYIVECKTSKLGLIKEANEAVYKLKTHAEIGGRRTKLILVSYQKVHSVAKKRAEEWGISVIDGNQLCQFKKIMEKIAKG